jgi:hypothetical protein
VTFSANHYLNTPFAPNGSLLPFFFPNTLPSVLLWMESHPPVNIGTHAIYG